ncbi:MAG: helix-turn-helix transcriptional regulator [Solirubrobacterales bacterium]|nr:helix-turn-helix transcriptional regulator [Solirubrobacterales bacterium]
MATIGTTADLGRKVRAARYARKLSQDALALASGTGRRFIVDLEHGKPTVRLSSVLAVLAALDLRLELTDTHAGGPDADA